MNTQIPLQKIKAILLYFCENTNPRFLGKVKLMKLFYFLDFLHVKKHGTPITYDCYYNLDHGPIPSLIKNLVDDVDGDIDNSSLADTIYIKKENGELIHRVQGVRNFTKQDSKIFATSELEVMKLVCSRFGESNTRQIETESHSEAPWQKTTFREKIPYKLAAQDPDCKVSEEDIILSLEILSN